ncbi:MAG: preprotein translocase subunit SecY [Candidatus Nanoarchaeia archaeon]|nr:preprotein translocase subunit SecY [Candidatus Nanoarchaeia archaeon]
MSIIDTLLNNLPEVAGPLQKKLSFKEKLKWTIISLVAFFLLSVIPLYGLGPNNLANFEQLSIILGASFGSIMSLGIGPIVTASIVLQLLNGSGIVKFDTATKEGRIRFQGIQKILAIFFIIFESIIYVFMGGLAPPAELQPAQYFFMEWILVAQLIVGGLIVLYLDEVMQKWGFGSGVSLFIAANVSMEVFVRALSPLTTTGTWAFGSGQAPVGQLWVFLLSLAGGDPTGAIIAISTILATVLVFFIATYFQSMKIEIPLSFGRVRGHGIRWPLHFLYTSNIPVILIAALIANIQLVAKLLENWGYPLLGTFSGSTPASGFIKWVNAPNILQLIITNSFSFTTILQSIIYVLFFIAGAVIFGLFWMQTAGMDASSQAQKIMDSGLQIPGFRRDQRVLESILKRYILPLTVMGAIAVGLLASLADLSGALGRGTGILLAVMIIYRLYEDVANQHMMDMYPALRKVMGK